MEEWRARVRAARGLRAKALVAGRSVLVNVEHLTIVRGRPVSRREVVAEFFDRPLRGLREQLSAAAGEARVSPAYRPGADVAVTVSDDGATVYVAHLPAGPILVLARSRRRDLVRGDRGLGRGLDRPGWPMPST